MDKLYIILMTMSLYLFSTIQSSKIGLCDVMMWYIDMLSEGVLHGDLNEKQQRIKTSVEKLMHSQMGTVELECETLALYQQILLENRKENVQSNGEMIGKTEADPVDAEPNPETDVTDTTESDEEEANDVHGITENDPKETSEHSITENPEETSEHSTTEDQEEITKHSIMEDPGETSKHSVVEDPTENEQSVEDHDIVINKPIDEKIRKGSSAEEVETQDYDETQFNKAEVDVTDTDTESDDYNNEIDSSIVNIDAESKDCGNKIGIKTFKIGPIGICTKDNVCDIFDFLFEKSVKSRLANITNEKIIETSQEDVFFGETVTHSDEDLIGFNSTKLKQPQKVEKNTANRPDLKDIEELLNKKKIEYAHKIQEIELHLLKLENRLLTETLGKQNNSASYVRLENLILKLENELLKINRSFVMIQEENNQLKDKQLSEEQIFELFNKARKENNEAEQKYLALADNSTALESMVDKQQSKIIELVLMMHNQTDFINKLEEKSQRLEQQNRELHEVLVNQSNMMSQLVKGMNYMKEEQEKLKSTVAQPLPLSTNILPIREDVSVDTDPPHARDERKDEDEIKDSSKIEKVIGITSEDEAKLNVLETVAENIDKSNEASSKYVSSEEFKQKETKKPKPTTKDEPASAQKRQIVIPETPKYFNSKPSGPKDCYDHFISGKRKRDMAMRVKIGPDDKDIQVFCDMKNGGWTVIMRRSDGSIDFFRDWNQYKNGFGGVLGEHWIGNDIIHLLTNQKNYRLRVEMTDWERNTAWAEYDYFMVDDESNFYKLHITGFNSDSSAGDGLLKHSGMKFSAKDVDNDLAVKDFGGSCANRFGGAWWYYKCYKSNLTGRYYRDGLITEGMYDGISWKSWKPSTVSLKKVEMKIIPRN